VWLADGDVRLEGRPLEWLPQPIVDVPRRQVSEMTTTGTNGERITIRRDADAAFELADDGAPDRHDSAAADAMASALEGLRFEEVRAAGKVEAAGSALGRAAITTDDGLVYRVRLIEESEEVWAIFSADVHEPTGKQRRYVRPPRRPISGREASMPGMANGRTSCQATSSTTLEPDRTILLGSDASAVPCHSW
jgi:hypothetical protein